MYFYVSDKINPVGLMLRICEHDAVSCWAVTALRFVFFWDTMLCVWVFSSWHFFLHCGILILEDTIVLSRNIRNPKPPMQQYVLDELIPHPYCCKYIRTHNIGFIYVCVAVVLHMCLVWTGYIGLLCMYFSKLNLVVQMSAWIWF
jgi:hypothetical protein